VVKGDEIMSSTETPKTEVTCALIKRGSTYAGKQGFDYFEGISAQTVGSAAICMHLLTIPPGVWAHAHLHENHETSIYLISGQAEMWYGPKLEHYMFIEPGDMIYIPAGVPHVPGNPSATEPATAVIARTDPNEQESVLLRPDLDELAPRSPANP
jgi:uncharacterized RmlC-like cupin family protein